MNRGIDVQLSRSWDILQTMGALSVFCYVVGLFGIVWCLYKIFRLLIITFFLEWIFG